MNDEALAAACRALFWERRYRIRDRHPARYVGHYFLPELDVLDPDFERALARHCPPAGALLEIGAGSGRQAICYARRGYRVTATDIADSCLVEARELASSVGIEVDFRKDDIGDTRLEPAFDIVCDRGCFAIIGPNMHPRYAANVARLMRAGGILLVKIDARKAHILERLAGFTRLSIEHSEFSGEGHAPIASILAAYRADRR